LTFLVLAITYLYTMKINFKNLKKGQSIPLLIIDMIMLSLISINLLWMTFDFFFEARIFQDLIGQVSESFFIYYRDIIHPDFLLYDSIFVTIFIIEILTRWIVSIVKKEYSNWIAYPFIHWYDVLGCIPVGGFRVLRMLRIVSIVIRLHKKQIINIRVTWWYKLLNRYYSILVEEVSDRVVVNVIKGMQTEIAEGSPITDELVEKVIKPKQEIIVEWLALRIEDATQLYFTRNSERLQQYIQLAVEEALVNNKDIGKLNSVPILGPKVTAAVSSSISDVSFYVIEKMIRDLSAKENREVLHEVMNMGLEVVTKKEEDETFQNATKEIIIDSLELVKEQVETKRWKEN